MKCENVHREIKKKERKRVRRKNGNREGESERESMLVRVTEGERGCMERMYV